MSGETGKKRFAMTALVAVLALTAVVRIIDIDKPYETWDEITTYAVGLYQWYNIARLDFSPESWHTYDQSGSIHPPMARYAYGIVNGIYIFSKLGPDLFSMDYNQATLAMYSLKSFVPGRLLSAVFAMGTSLFTFFITRRHFGLRVAFMASVLFALLPVSVAQTRLAALDSMLVFMYTLSVYLFERGLDDRRYFFASLLSTGIAVATKFNAITLFILLPALYFAKRGPKTVKKKELLLIPLVSAALLFAVWPRIWFDPIGGLVSNYSWWESLGNVSEYFFGGLGHPVQYMATYFVVTIPAVVLVMLAIGSIKSLRRRDFGSYVFLLWLLLPLGVYSLYHFRQAGPKYIFMIYPAASVLAALGMHELSSRFGGLSRGARSQAIAYAAIPTLVFAYLVLILISFHPYYLDYYNELVGGPKNVYENHMFAVGQWGEGIDGAAFWINDNAASNSTVQFFVMPRHVIPPIRDDITDLKPFIPKYISGTDNINWDMTNVTARADYVVENTFFRVYMNQSFHELIAGDYELVKTIDVQGAPLAWIYKRIQI